MKACKGYEQVASKISGIDKLKHEGGGGGVIVKVIIHVVCKSIQVRVLPCTFMNTRYRY